MNSTTVLNSSTAPGSHEGDHPRLSNDVPRLYRWRFNLTTGTVREEAIDDTACEFPRVNERYLGRPTCYGYTARIKPGAMPLFDGLIKYDLMTGSSQTHYFRAGR